jgi:hypothetical protein
VSIGQSSGNILDQSYSGNYGTYNSMKDASIKLNTGSAVADGSVAGYNTVSGSGRLNVKRTTSREWQGPGREGVELDHAPLARPVCTFGVGQARSRLETWSTLISHHVI